MHAIVDVLLENGLLIASDIFISLICGHMYWLGYIIGKKKSTINFWIRKASCSQTVFSIYLAVKSSFFPLVNSILTKMYTRHEYIYDITFFKLVI